MAFAAAPAQPVAVKSVEVVQTLRHEPAMVVMADEGFTGTASGPGSLDAGGPFAVVGGLRPLNALGPLNQLAAQARGDLSLPARPAPFVLNLSVIQSGNMPPGVLRTSLAPVDPSADPPSHDGPMPLVFMLANGRGVDNSSGRLLAWMAPMVPGDVTQGQVPGFGPFDPRGRLAELMHDALFAGHLAWSSDGAHSTTDGALGDDASLEGERHAINPALFGQSAADDSSFAGSGRSVMEADRPWFDFEAGEAADAPDREAASHLVAAGDATATLASAVWAAGSRAVGAAIDGDAFDSALHDLLAPRFAFDAAALSDAIRDLVDDADELGIGLLGLVTDPTRQGEVALVAAVAAGLAYRHWRGRERREQAESREMLAARFVRGPASPAPGRRTCP
ncbi:MAG TPA: hypothetical protein VG826_01595 [Pirellulales bacterium]|nr:hypothetical protein [Pirellulales bacterium]